MKQAAQSVSEYESTEKDRLLASLEKKKVAARTAKLIMTPRKGSREQKLILRILILALTCLKCYRSRYQTSGGTRVRFFDPGSEQCMNWNDCKRGVPGSMFQLRWFMDVNIRLPEDFRSDIGRPTSEDALNYETDGTEE